MNAISQAGHPKGLFVLFFSEMWERFCYYGMRALLTLYLIETLLKGDSEAFLIYGTYTALVYAAPVLGGKLADNLLGYRNAVILGGILMAIGEFMILGGTESWLFIGMSAIIIGNGYFKANISSIVGKLYKDGDTTKRDAGFTIFYIGINIGALLATTVCAEVGKTYGYEYGFALAGFGMILGVLTFVIGSKTYAAEAQPPDPVKLNEPWLGPLSRHVVTIIGSVLAIPVLFLLINYNEIMPFLLAGTAIYVVYNLISEGGKDGPVYRDRMVVMIILFVFNIVFWACFEQAGTSLTLFAKRNVNRMIFGWEMGPATTQFFNPAYIIIFGSVFSAMWVALERMKRNPNIPLKFGLGIIQLGLGYLAVLFGALFLSDAYLVPIWTLALLYLLHTTGELFLSPIGLSMVTKLAPARLTGTAMGGWFLSFAFANYVAAIIATATGVGHGGGGDKATETPTYAQYQQTAQEQVEAISANTQALLAQLDQLDSKIDGIAGDDESLKRLPSEIRTMANAVVPNYTKVNQELRAFFQDSTSYTGTKAINFSNLIPFYADGASLIADNLKSLTDLSSKLGQGESYESLNDEFGATVVGIGDGFNTINEKIVTRVLKFNEGFDLPESKEAFEAFEPEYATLASHFTWEIYLRVYTIMGLITIAIGVILCLINKPLNRMMHGVT